MESHEFEAMGFGHFPFDSRALFSTFSITPNMGKPHVMGPATRHITLSVDGTGSGCLPCFSDKDDL